VDNIYPFKTKVSHQQREHLLKQKSKLLWFTGLSGSGKSTLAVQLEAELHKLDYKTYLLDGDNVRSGINKDLTFGEAGRVENIRRIGEVAKLFLDAGIVVIASFISPFKKDRDQVKSLVGEDRYFEVFVDCPLAECERRDVKGLYKKARAGEIKEFTGISSPYERPENPDIIIPSAEMPIADSINLLLEKILPLIGGVK
jgi:adenylyl-sulfate kinase